MAWHENLPWIIAQAAPAEAPAEAGHLAAINLLIAVAVIVGSFAGGALIARRLRMKDYSFKIGLVLFTLVAGLAINFMGWPPKRGIDLSGGVVLVYEVESGQSQPGAMEALVGRINEQLNADGGEKLEARPVSADQIEIAVPEGVDASRVERAVTELRETAGVPLRSAGRRSENGKTVLVYRVDQRQQKSIDMNKLIAAVGRRINPSGVKELTIRQYGAEQLEVIIPEIEDREVDQIKRKISTSGLLEFRIVANQNDDKDLIKVALKTPGRDVYVGGHLAGRWVQAGPDLDLRQATVRDTKGRGREVLVRIDPYDVDGRYLSRSSPDFAEGRLAVAFSFDSVGAEKFGQLTSHNLPDPAIQLSRRLGIILDNVMLSAPNINSTIRGNGIITGNFTQQEVDFLVGVLNAGSLPATLRPEPISQQRISSQLGDDTIRMGRTSIIISTLAILIFMAVYYRFCGLVADVAVVLNMVVTVALMILIKAAFTLPGLAGLVLTVGMAVDANVLIYERMREETERGASLRMAIRNGFGRAMATIIDSHVTTLVSAAVLYVVGTDQIKGFAVTLIIGLLMSLFTAVFVARVIFDVAEKKHWLTRLKLMHVIGHTNIDFIRWRSPAIAASVAIILIGFVATYWRGKEILDIDFTGGSSVQLVFAEDKPHGIAEVRRVVQDLPDVAVSSVGDKSLEFKVDTSDRDIQQVQSFLQNAFPGSLRTYSMTFGALATIEPPKKEAEARGPELSRPDEQTPARPAESEQPAEPASKPAATPKADESPPGEPAPAKPSDEPASKPADTPKKDDELPEPQKPKSSLKPASRAIQLASSDPAQSLAALLLAQNDKLPAAGSSTAQDAADAQNATPPVDAAMIGGTRATLTFPEEISYPPLHEMVQREVNELEFKGVEFELHNPNYQLGSDARYKEWTLETSLKQDQTRELLTKVQQKLSATAIFPSSNRIGGKVAADTQLKALYALLASMVIIVVYIWIRFNNVVFGLAAVVALVHDVFITTGFLAMSYYLSPFMGWLQVDPFKISLPVLAALLTIVGYSINDTIVVFDRIREVRGKSPDLTVGMINLSVNATLSRTLLTSGTVFIASVILYFIGGPGIHAFAYSMVIGVIAGTYSSVYIAAPVLLWLKKPVTKMAKPGSALSSAAAASNK